MGRDVLVANEAGDAVVDDLADATPSDVMDAGEVGADASDAREVDAKETRPDAREADAMEAGADVMEVGDASGVSDASEAGADVTEVGADVLRCDAGASVVGGACVVISAPRQVAPLSTTTVTSQTPRLRWELRPGTDGARIELCRERACTTVVHRFDAMGSTAITPMTLTPGTWFWRAVGMRAGEAGTGASATWQFVVGHRSATVNTAWGSAVDFNGDGDADLAFAVGSTVYVYYGTGAGLATSAVTIGFEPATVLNLSGVGVDVNGDGYGDLAVTTRPPASATLVGVLFMGGPTGLARTPLRSFDPVVRSARLVGDVNGDGYGDLALDDYIAMGAPGGPVDGRTSLPSPSSPLFDAAGDMNGDGLADVAAVTRNAADRFLVDIQLRVASGAGVFASYGPAISPVLIGFSCGDADGDGRADYTSGRLSSGSLLQTLYWGGVFSPVMTFTSGAILLGRMGDVDGDGMADTVGRVVSSAGFLDTIVVFGDERRDLSRRQVVRDVGGAQLTSTQFGVIGDFDRDRGDDIAAVLIDEPAVVVLRASDIVGGTPPSRRIRIVLSAGESVVLNR